MKKTQSEQILDHMLSGNSITPIDALQMFGCFRLAARIDDLRKLGYNIKTSMVTNRYNKTFASYSIQTTKIVKNQYQFV